ncbi:MAG: CDP-alcohol phosphatidyltransferase family protein [Patescibacteria group bacterium]|jgi:CDP-diacylglycerol--glycerol-3-phosphate 3-phosphatidyltransferase
MEETVQTTAPKLYPHDKVMKALVLPFVPAFVKPNYVTAFRLLFTPVIFYLFMKGYFTLAVPAFIFAAFTDALDGSLARVRNQITPWGIFFDPLADKLLIGGTALLVAINYYHPIIIILALVLDVMPSILWASTKRGMVVMMANWWGKTKMILQVLSMTVLLIGIMTNNPGMISFGEVTLGISLVFAFIAVVTYSL